MVFSRPETVPERPIKETHVCPRGPRIGDRVEALLHVWHGLSPHQEVRKTHNNSDYYMRWGPQSQYMYPVICEYAYMVTLYGYTERRRRIVRQSHLQGLYSDHWCVSHKGMPPYVPINFSILGCLSLLSRPRYH